MSDFNVGDRVIYTSVFANEPKGAPGRIEEISEPWTTGQMPIKVRLDRYQYAVWAIAGELRREPVTPRQDNEEPSDD
jgi:hypothetical protein